MFGSVAPSPDTREQNVARHAREEEDLDLEEVIAISRWSSASADHRKAAHKCLFDPEGVAEACRRILDSLAGTPSGCNATDRREPVVSASLDHRLIAATPAGVELVRGATNCVIGRLLFGPPACRG